MKEPLAESWLSVECDEIEEWDVAIECLRNRVLADEDWQMEPLTLDLDPQQNHTLKTNMGIQRDYFIDIPPDVTNEEAEAARWRIVSLGRKVQNEPNFWPKTLGEYDVN